MNELKTWEVLKAQTEELRVEFLRTDIALCMTFSNLVTTELGMHDRPAAERVFMKAERGYDTIARFLRQMEDGQQKREIGQELAALRTALDAANGRLHSGEGSGKAEPGPGELA